VRTQKRNAGAVVQSFGQSIQTQFISGYEGLDDNRRQAEPVDFQRLSNDEEQMLQ